MAAQELHYTKHNEMDLISMSSSFYSFNLAQTDSCMNQLWKYEKRDK